MKKKLSIFLAAALAAAALTGCGAPAASTEPAPTMEQGREPGSQEVNYVMGEGIATGGSALPNSNCSSVEITDGEAVTIRLEFTSGSERNGTAETAADHVPDYSVSLLSEPARLVVEFETLSFWDYDRLLDCKPGDRLIHAAFKQFQNDSEHFRIFFQLKSDVDVTVREEGSSLVLTLTEKAEEPEGPLYYLVLDDYNSFCEGNITPDSGFAPTLADDLLTPLLISEHYATKEEAEAAANEWIASEATEYGETLLTVQQLAHNQLPAVYHETGDEAVYDTAVASLNGESTVLPVVMPNGVYLCSSPDGARQVFSCITRNYDNNGLLSGITEQLWAMDSDGDLIKLIDSEFETIELAAFSPDGRKLAILERASGISYVYILDLDTGTLTNISEEGLGKITNYFIWDQLGTELYLMSGNNSVKLMKYDFTIADFTQRITEVEEGAVDGADMAFYNGDLYYTDTNKDGTMYIYRIKPEGGLRAEFIQGDSFSISPDGRYMAVSRSIAQGDSEQETLANTSVLLLDMETGEQTWMIQNSYVVKTAWSEDGKAVYYTLGSEAAAGTAADDVAAEDENEDEIPVEEEFTFTLYRYDVAAGASEECAKLASSNFNVTPTARTLYIPYYYADETTSLRATYLLNVGE